MAIVVLVVIAVMLAGAVAFAQQYGLVQAKQRYKAALDVLSTDPKNNVKRIAALEAGRAYARQVRSQGGQKGIAVFDEVALQNDLAARLGVSAAAPPSSTQVEQAAPSTSLGTPAGPPSVANRTDLLLKLAGLHEKGLLSKEEFEREKRRLLDG